MRKTLLLLLFFLSFLNGFGDGRATYADFLGYVRNVATYNRNYPQEKVYLHMDNRSYYVGDTIWFKAYVMSATILHPTQTSGVLYVELLDENGVEKEHRKLQLKNGMCHGEFPLDSTYRTGFYEIRAYTRNMLNWGNEARSWTVRREPAPTAKESERNIGIPEYMKVGSSMYAYNGTSIDYNQIYCDEIVNQDILADYNHCVFSRVFPVYMKPQKSGEYKEETDWYPMHSLLAMPQEIEEEFRKDLLKISFYPEGGSLVEGVSSIVAFEAMDQWGRHCEVDGYISTTKKQKVTDIATKGRGRGTFTLCPQPKQKYLAHIVWKGKEYQFDLPVPHPEGLALHVVPPVAQGDATVTIEASIDTLLLGWALQCRGALVAFDTLTAYRDSLYTFRIPYAHLNPGVNQLTLFDGRGEILADRLFFVSPSREQTSLKIVSMPDTISPYEQVTLALQATGEGDYFTQGHFSIAVTDADERGEPSFDTRDIRSELLLSSDLKGFIKDVDSYFCHSNDTAMAVDIDQLMLVQGWRRYEWKTMTDKEWIPEFLPEKGLQIDGYVVSDVVSQRDFAQADKYGRIANVKLGVSIHNDFVNYAGTCTTDKNGSFYLDIDRHFLGEAPMTITLYDNLPPSGKRTFKKPRLRYSYPVIQRAFSPSPAPYSWFQNHLPEEEMLMLLEDSLQDFSMEGDIAEVTIKKRRRGKSEIYYERPEMVIDYFKEWNHLIDRGVPNANIFFDDGLWNMQLTDYDKISRNQPLHYSLSRGKLWGKIGVSDTTNNVSRTRLYRMPKTIKVYSNLVTRNPIALPIDPSTDGRKYVFLHIERHKRSESPQQPPHQLKDGTRHTYYEGYSRVSEFYSPDYSESVVPDTTDYRRTLYWNPDVYTDHLGCASVTFYNNAHTKHLHIRAEGFARNGDLIVLDSDKKSFSE